MRKIIKITKNSRSRRETAYEHDEAGKICKYYGVINHTLSSWEYPSEPEGTIPVKFGECPECGRRLKLKIVFGHDAEQYYELPRHKKKGWWRKVKKVSRENHMKRR